MAASKILLAGRGSNGLFIKEGINFSDSNLFQKTEKSSIKALAFSKNGNLIAYNDGAEIQVLRLPECRHLYSINRFRTVGLAFSPLGNLLVTWEPHGASKSDNEQGFNLHVYDAKTGQCVKGFHQKRQVGWQPQWTDDEKLVTRMVNNEVHFYANNNFDTIVSKIHLQKVAEYSLAFGAAPHHVTCFVHGGSSGQPSSIKLYCYPNFESSNSVIASKSLFKADNAQLKWNTLGSACLATVSVDTDKSGSSYYGEQTLHLLTTKGVSCHVQLAKIGPIYSAEWSPTATEFCVIYGFMPAKATLYNVNAEVTFDFGTSPRNSIYYNAFGNLLILAGFGNLNGNIEIWDLKQKKEIVRTLARDTTYLEWCANGEQFLTATLSPRLRVGNGFKIWSYTGKNIYEFACSKSEELWEVLWRPFEKNIFKENKLVYNVTQSSAEKQPEVYRPPAARGITGLSSVKIHDDFEKPSNAKNTNENASKSALKNKKKREARKSRKDHVDEIKSEDLTTTEIVVNKVEIETTNNPEKDKKIKNITKKLEQINLLKQQLASGKQLEKNQLDKIKTEQTLFEELKQLK